MGDNQSVGLHGEDLNPDQYLWVSKEGDRIPMTLWGQAHCKTQQLAPFYYGYDNI
jgi:hypothetical protein